MVQKIQFLTKEIHRQVGRWMTKRTIFFWKYIKKAFTSKPVMSQYFFDGYKDGGDSIFRSGMRK